MVQIDVAGPRLPRTYDIMPDEIRHLADVVLNSCVTGPFEIGGFATSDLQVMAGWLTAEETKLDRPFRESHQHIFHCRHRSGDRHRPTADVFL